MVEVRSHVIAAAVRGRGPAHRRPRHGTLAHRHAVARPPGLTAAAAAAAAAGPFFPGGFEGISVRASGAGGAARRLASAFLLGHRLRGAPRARATFRARGGRAARVHAGGMGACLTRQRQAQQRFGSGAAWAGRSPPGSPARGGAGVAPVTSQRCARSHSWARAVTSAARAPASADLFACHVARSRLCPRSLFPGVRGLLVSGNARAGDDMAALAWQLGAGAAGPASRDDGGDGGFGFATAASPLAAMLTEARAGGAAAQCAAPDAPCAPAAAGQQRARGGRPPVGVAAG